MVQKVNKTPLISDGNFIVAEVKELNFFDLTGEKAKTIGTSSKSYHLELQISKLNNEECQLYTIWGPTGAPNQTKEWRHYTSRSKADKDFAAIVKSKTSKGYRIIDVAQRAQGSDEAKAITKAVILKGAEQISGVKDVQVCKLALPTQQLISQLFGATSNFVATTLKCPLGQLSNLQIDRGREALDKAKIILNSAQGISLSKNQLSFLQGLTNDFYGEVPHNFGQGYRGQMTHLLFDDISKVMAKENDLDTLWDAKSVGAVLNSNSGVDAQYRELNADLTLIDPADPLFKFMSTYFLSSKVRAHGYGTATVKNLWQMARKDQESNYFLENTERIAKECGKHHFVQEARSLCPDVENWTPNRRPDLDKDLCDKFNKANTWLCWHGTRSANVVGITKRGLLIRPAGAVHTGSALGDAKYFAWQSTKSLNYTDGAHWTGGRTKNSSRFMFLLDVCFGNMHLAKRSHFYSSPPKGYHSVYGKAGYAFQNDEMTTYDFKQQDTQSRIRYLFEISDD